jgi:nitric oxide reductase NorQ protein
LEEGVSTRMLIYTATLIRAGVEPRESCEATMTQALTDEPDVIRALRGIVDAHFA